MKNEYSNVNVSTVILESVYEKSVFRTSADKERMMSVLLEGKRNPNVSVLGYTVLDNACYVLVASPYNAAIKDYAYSIANAYYAVYNAKRHFDSFPFREPITIVNVAHSNIGNTLGHIHRLVEYSGKASYTKYKYSSAYRIFQNQDVIVDVELLKGLTGTEVLNAEVYNVWHGQNGVSLPAQRMAREKFSDVMDSLTIKYHGANYFVDETILLQYIVDINERCQMPYKKILRKLSINGSRREDLLIELIIYMCFKRRYPLFEALERMQITNVLLYNLVVEIIMTLNSRCNFGYDYMINTLGIEDSDYYLLVEIMNRMHRMYPDVTFAQLARDFQLQLHLDYLRSRIDFE